jgi:micrococcal nuclease
MHEYKVNILKVVDGDTVDVDIDLGFGIWLRNERVRLLGIDTPESRTSDKIEKIFGFAAKNRLISLLGAEAILQTQVSKKGDDMKGKFGRILGNFITINGEKCAAVLIREGHAVGYTGGNKEKIQQQHLANRQRLIDEGKVPTPDGMTLTPGRVNTFTATKPAINQKPIVEEVVEEVVAKKAPVKKKTAKKKTTAKKK